MTTIAQKMWRGGVPGPDGGLVQIAERPTEFTLVGVKEPHSMFKCLFCDALTMAPEAEQSPACCKCGFALLQSERL